MNTNLSFYSVLSKSKVQVKSKWRLWIRPKVQVFHCKLSILHSTLFSAFLFVSAYSPFIIMLSIIWYLLLPLTFYQFTISSRDSFRRQFLLSQWPSQFFSYLSVPAFFSVCSFYTLHPSPYPHLKCFQFLFAHSVLVPKSLHHTTVHSTRSTSPVSS